MDLKNYSRLAAVIFGVIALLQLVRVVLAWEVTLNGVAIPQFVSGMAAFVAAIMAWLGLARRGANECTNFGREERKSALGEL